mmetsp:Transcript_14998/g.19004  ORF Transcript_14998/g.19004 Transcript_14998/m.19004 type:complete len:275 (+) Transcript_14998:67-891(+)
MVQLISHKSIVVTVALLTSPSSSFTVRSNDWSFNRGVAVFAERQGGMEYKNAATSILSNFMGKESKGQGDGDANDSMGMNDSSFLSKIDFTAPKISNVPLETLASMLDAELYEREWFVTGNVNPIYFSDEFEFQDPDVKLSGIEEYAKGVNKLFDQETSRAEIISTVVNENTPNTITVTWRLSGKVNIGPGLTIKPYICYTDFKVDSDGLIVFQEDRFDIEQWDILLSALFPFLIGKVTSQPAPPVPPREVPIMPKVSSNGGFNFEFGIGQLFK